MNLFGKLRTRILSLLFLNEEKEYYIREIATLTGVSPRGAQKELINLEREGVLESELRGKQRYFSVNRQNPAHRELKSLILKNYGVPPLLRDAITDIENIREAHIRTLMRKMGIEAVYQKPRLSKPHPAHKIYPYLLRNKQITRANHVWAADITYLPMA